MLDTLKDTFSDLLGLSLDSQELGAHHMALRALLVYLIVLVIVRAGHKRFLGKGTAFDVILGILLGSVASRAITGNAPFFPTLVACAVLVALHTVFAWSAFRIPWLPRLIEGESVVLARNRKTLPDAMRGSDVTQEDLEEGLRIQGVEDIGKVDLAQLERNGKISVIEKG